MISNSTPVSTIERSWRPRSEYVWLALIVALALGLRLVHLGTASYWHDEAHNLIKSEHIKAYLLHGELESNHPPAFPVLVTLWRAIGLGRNEWTMRMLNVVLGLAGIVALYVFGKRLFSARAGLCAAFLLAISPFHITHSQDLKEYMVLPFTCIVMLQCLYNAMEGNRPRQWVLYGVMASVVVYSETFSAFLFVATAIWVLMQMPARRDRLKGWFLANLAGAISFLPWLRIMLFKADRILFVTQDWWVPKPDLHRLFFYLKTIAFGYSGLKPAYLTATAIFGIAAAVGVWLAWRNDWRKGSLLIIWFAPPIAMVYVMSLFTQSIFLIRAMLPFALPVYLWVGLAIAAIRLPVLRGAALACFAVIASISLYQKYTWQFTPYEFPNRPGIHPPVEYKEAAHYITHHWKPGDVVVETSISAWLSMYWYGIKHDLYTVALDQNYINFIWKSNIPTFTLPELAHYMPCQIQPVVAGKKRVWLILSEWERQYLWNNPMTVWRWMDSHYVEQDHQSFGGFEILFYEAKGATPPVVSRDDDDGITRELRYAGDRKPYHQWQPDGDLIWAPPEKRRGPLLLHFTTKRDGAPVRLGSGEATQTVGFETDNRGSKDVTCQVRVLACDSLLEAASLSRTKPRTNVWLVTQMYNPTPPPGNYEMDTAKAHFIGAETAQLTGTVALAPGTYDTFICANDAPVTPKGPTVSIAVAGVNIAAGVPMAQRAWTHWPWYTGAPVSLGAGAGVTPVRVTATAAKGAKESWYDFAYVAFQRRAATEPAIPRPEAWNTQVTIPAGKSRRWLVTFPSGRKRIDVWVFEREPKGYAYRIFRVLRGAAGTPTPARSN